MPPKRKATGKTVEETKQIVEKNVRESENPTTKNGVTEENIQTDHIDKTEKKTKGGKPKAKQPTKTEAPTEQIQDGEHKENFETNVKAEKKTKSKETQIEKREVKGRAAKANINYVDPEEVERKLKSTAKAKSKNPVSEPPAKKYKKKNEGAEKSKKGKQHSTHKAEEKSSDESAEEEKDDEDDDDVTNTKSIYEFTAKDINGKDVSFDRYKGHVCIIVNVASKCGHTKSNYEQFVQLYDKYSEDKGLKILAFPCNQFGKQEPGDSQKIQEFVNKRNVKFDMFEKTDVNGKNAHPLWTYLKSKIAGTKGENIEWNFTKFIIDKEGNVVERHKASVKPMDLLPSLEKLW